MSTVRDNGAWPIDTNLATWNTTLAMNALGTDDFEPERLVQTCVEWLLGCQNKKRSPIHGWPNRADGVGRICPGPFRMLTTHQAPCWHSNQS